MNGAAGKDVIAAEKSHLRRPAGQKNFKIAVIAGPQKNDGRSIARLNHSRLKIRNSNSKSETNVDFQKQDKARLFQTRRFEIFKFIVIRSLRVSVSKLQFWITLLPFVSNFVLRISDFPKVGLFFADIAQQLFPFCIFFLVLLHGHTGFGIVALEGRLVDGAIETEFTENFLAFGT